MSLRLTSDEARHLRNLANGEALLVQRLASGGLLVQREESGRSWVIEATLCHRVSKGRPS